MTKVLVLFPSIFLTLVNRQTSASSRADLLQENPSGKYAQEKEEKLLPFSMKEKKKQQGSLLQAVLTVIEVT